MITFALSTGSSAILLGLGWLGAGATVGVLLTRAGQPSATAVSALAAWPLLIPLLRAPSPGSGPYAARIAAAFRALSATLADPAAGEVPWQADLAGLEEALLRADTRMALVDRLLADSGDAAGPALDALKAARAHAASEIEAVLSGVAQLRLQVGLVALAGDAAPVRERLRELELRARALDEVARIQLGAQVRADG